MFAEFKSVEQSGSVNIYLGTYSKMVLSYTDHDIQKNLHSEALVVR